MRVRAVLAAFGFTLLAGCHHYRGPEGIPSSLDTIAGEHRQVVMVEQKECSSLSPVVVRLLERTDGWREVGRMDGVAGRNGIAPPGEKREGDGRTPSGTFPLARAFGYAPLDTGFPYLTVTQDMIWVDDPKSPLYNYLVTKSEGAGVSYEVMRRDDDLYKYGIVVEYNTGPVVRGAGSAIFFHIWKSPSTPTAGCVALAEPDILRILGWLERGKAPVTLILPPLACSGNPGS